GGAPCNFAYHACGVGHQGMPLSRIGEDRLGDEIIATVEGLGMPPQFIQRDQIHPTGTVLVELDRAGAPGFTIVEDVAWDYMEPDEQWLDLAAGADAVCFGTLAQRSRQGRATIQHALAAAGNAMRLCDINFRQRFYSHQVVTESLAAATALKLNEQEATQLGELLCPGARLGRVDLMRGLIADYGLELVCITLGADGCRIVTADEEVARPVPPTQVVDTVGSGDAFAAGLVTKHLEGAPLASVAEAGNLLGAYVAGRRGATPALTDEVLTRFRAL
ncbi:MAG: carbohydrate kinase family protein, partial [Planctomycetota bacterium]